MGKYGKALESWQDCHASVPEVEEISWYRFVCCECNKPVFPVSRMNLLPWLILIRIQNNLHHDYTLVDRVSTAEVSDKLVDKKVMLVPQSTLLLCCSVFLGFSFHRIIRIYIWMWCFVWAIGEGSMNAENELLMLDPYSVCLKPPAPGTFTNARSFNFLCKINLQNCSPRSKPKSGGGRAPLGGKMLPANACLALMLRLWCSMPCKELVNNSSQRALIPGSVRCTVSRSSSDKTLEWIISKKAVILLPVEKL